MGGGPTRERGRPARMHSRCVPLSFPAIRRPATKRDGSPHRQGCGPRRAGLGKSAGAPPVTRSTKT